MRPFLCERWRSVESPIGRADPRDGKRMRAQQIPQNIISSRSPQLWPPLRTLQPRPEMCSAIHGRFERLEVEPMLMELVP
jgi:hypothetical protein